MPARPFKRSAIYAKSSGIPAYVQPNLAMVHLACDEIAHGLDKLDENDQ